VIRFRAGDERIGVAQRNHWELASCHTLVGFGVRQKNSWEFASCHAAEELLALKPRDRADTCRASEQIARFRDSEQRTVDAGVGQKDYWEFASCLHTISALEASQGAGYFRAGQRNHWEFASCQTLVGFGVR
jgi:hypothetical protein